MRNTSGTHALVCAAISGMLVAAAGCDKSSAAPAGNTTAKQTTTDAKHACKGQNDCKGQGGCKTDKHACKGQNDCKGQGGCGM